MTTIPIVTVAAEIGVTTDELANDLGPDVQRDEIGLRVVSAELAAGLIAADREVKAAKARRAAERAERDKAAREKARAETAAMRERERRRRQLIDEQQAAIRASNPNVSAVELLMVGSDSAAMSAANERLDDYFTGGVRYHPIQTED